VKTVVQTVVAWAFVRCENCMHTGTQAWKHIGDHHRHVQSNQKLFRHQIYLYFLVGALVYLC